jgi:DNA invertase Pin-like site-specific DNA recombinase
MAHVLATFAQFERRLIGQRTREALAVKPKLPHGEPIPLRTRA